MKKISVILSLLLILVVSTSCLPSSPKTTQKDIDQDTVISDLKTTVSSLKETRVSTETFNGLKDRVTALENKPAPAPTTPTDVYTKSQVDQAIAQAVTNAVNNLKNDQAWIKSTSSTSSHTSSSNSDDDVIASDGDLELVELTHLGDEVYFNNNSSQTWKLIVRNNDTSRHYFKLTLDMSLDDGSSVTFLAPNYVTVSTSYPSSGQFRTSTNFVNPISEINYTLYNDANPTSTYKVYIGKDTEQTIYVTVTMYYSGSISGKLWNCEFDIKEYDD